MLLKKDNIKEHVQEYLKCKNNFEYFARHYLYLELAGGDALFQPYKKQVELTDLISKDKHVVVLKSRQVGISTTIQGYCAWLLNFYDNCTIGIISKDGREATDFARSIRGMIEKLPRWMKSKSGKIDGNFDKKSEQSFILSNGAKLFTATVNPNAPTKTLRGKALTFLIIDEAAFINHLDDAWTSIVPALSTAQKQARLSNVPYGTIVLSTPNKTMGMGAWYYQRYTNAINGNGIFKPFVIHWKDIPELAEDPEWYKKQCEMFDNDPKKIQQELELKFIPAGGAFYDEQTCITLQDLPFNPLEVNKLFGGEIQIFEKAKPGKFYITGVDTAPEFGNDSSTITVWDYETLEQIAEYEVKCKVLDFVKVVKFFCAQYPGMVVIENNSYGNQVMEEINNSEYSTMMYKEKRGNNIVPGLSNNSKSRPLMMDALYSYVTQFPNIIKSKRLALQLIGLVEKNGKVEADTGCKDDLALSAAFAFYVRKYDPPLLLDIHKFDSSIFDEVVQMNYKDYNKTINTTSKNNIFDDELEESNIDVNARIMKRIKNETFTFENSFVDILDFYKE